MKNPFEYGNAVRGNAFYDRDEIKRDIMNVIDGSNNVLLYGPRRYGKSSLVTQIFDELTARGVHCVLIDMMEIRTVDAFVRRYAEAVYRALAPSGGALNRITGLFKSIRPSLTMNDEGRPELSVSFASRTVSDSELCEAFDLPEKLADGRPVVIAIDEFQEVSRLMPGRGFERIMRSRIQHHGNVSYIFLGSRKHMLRRMFTTRKEPFYNSAETFLLEKPPQTDSEQFIIRRFKSVGIKVTVERARRIVELADNIPYYLQAVSSWIYSSVVARNAKTVEDVDIDDGYTRMFNSKTDLFETMFSNFSPTQCALLVALAKETTGRFDEAYRSRHALGGSSTVNTALKQLLESGDIDVVEGRNVIADPLFAVFLRKCGA